MLLADKTKPFPIVVAPGGGFDDITGAAFVNSISGEPYPADILIPPGGGQVIQLASYAHSPGVADSISRMYTQDTAVPYSLAGLSNKQYTSWGFNNRPASSNTLPNSREFLLSVTFVDNGNYVFAVKADENYGTPGQTVIYLARYTLMTPYDTSTRAAGSEQLVEIFRYPQSNGTDTITGISVAPDGSRLTTLGAMPIGKTFYQYDLSIPFDLTTAAVANTFIIDNKFIPNGAYVCDFEFSPSGNEIAILYYNSTLRKGAISIVSLATPFDASTMDTLLVNFQLRTTSPYGLAFSDNGEHLYATFHFGQYIEHYQVTR